MMMRSFLTCIIHSFLGDLTLPDKRSPTNTTLAPVKYRIACDAIDWIFDSDDPYFKVYLSEGDESLNYAYYETTLGLFATIDRDYHYTIYPQLVNSTKDYYALVIGTSFKANAC
ncbi:hypothetical protein CPB86DRAFT_536339 [Serendipita vermifera]|nr:hypothetical protein CPB86DRAFT_536339 [Serendipita vermifera]